MSSVLPQNRLAPTRVNPKISLFYGLPKVGKTTLLSLLESCLILDTEGGADTLNVMRIRISSISGPTIYEEDGVTVKSTSMDQVYRDIVDYALQETARTGKKPKPPYKFLALDTVDKFEDLCEVTATEKYKQTTIGKSFTGKTVLELPQGGGYYHLRNEVLFQLDRLSTICEYLILISHIKEKLLNKGGIEVSVRDISLTGKLGSMVAAKADIIGYLYREAGRQDLMVSFETFENAVMGSRFSRLAGQKFPFDWNTIFLEEGSITALQTAQVSSK